MEIDLYKMLQIIDDKGSLKSKESEEYELFTRTREILRKIRAKIIEKNTIEQDREYLLAAANQIARIFSFLYVYDFPEFLVEFSAYMDFFEQNYLSGYEPHVTSSRLTTGNSLFNAKEVADISTLQPEIIFNILFDKIIGMDANIGIAILGIEEFKSSLADDKTVLLAPLSSDILFLYSCLRLLDKVDFEVKARVMTAAIKKGANESKEEVIMEEIPQETERIILVQDIVSTGKTEELLRKSLGENYPSVRVI